MDDQTMYFLAMDKIRAEGWSRIPIGHVEAFLRYAAANGGPDGLEVEARGEFARIGRPPTPRREAGLFDRRGG